LFNQRLITASSPSLELFDPFFLLFHPMSMYLLQEAKKRAAGGRAGELSISMALDSVIARRI
jgi:hypothetical protein